jgi:mannose-6-phosphate isomerase-like protein (cupin superfamily)
MTEPFVGDLEAYTKRNTDFRRVLFSARHAQLVVMNLRPGEEIGTEVHEVGQLLYVISGEGRVVLDGLGYEVEKGTVVCVPAGMQHNVIASTFSPMKLFTIYAPPEHTPGTVHRTRVDAEVEDLLPALSA